MKWVFERFAITDCNKNRTAASNVIECRISTCTDFIIANTMTVLGVQTSHSRLKYPPHSHIPKQQLDGNRLPSSKTPGLRKQASMCCVCDAGMFSYTDADIFMKRYLHMLTTPTFLELTLEGQMWFLRSELQLRLG